MALDAADVLAIHDLVAKYGHVVDDADWARLSEVFSSNGIFDLDAIGLGRTEGIDELRACFARLNHPLAHHTTNVTVELVAEDRARVRSKYLVVSDEGRARTGEYRDDVVRTPEGWRLQCRTVVPRRALRA